MFISTLSSILCLVFSITQTSAVMLPARENKVAFARDDGSYLYIQTGPITSSFNPPSLPPNIPDNINVTMAGVLYDLSFGNTIPGDPFYYCEPKSNGDFSASFYQLMDNTASLSSFQSQVQNDYLLLLEMADYIIGQMQASNAAIVCANMYTEEGYIGGGVGVAGEAATVDGLQDQLPAIAQNCGGD